MRKVIALVLTFVMCFSMVCMPAYAASTTDAVKDEGVSTYATYLLSKSGRWSAATYQPGTFTVPSGGKTIKIAVAMNYIEDDGNDVLILVEKSNKVQYLYESYTPDSGGKTYSVYLPAGTYVIEFQGQAYYSFSIQVYYQ